MLLHLLASYLLASVSACVAYVLLGSLRGPDALAALECELMAGGKWAPLRVLAPT